MSIDWMIVAAQIANFLLLVWLLKKFLYRPILDGIAAREQEIAQRLQNAEDAQKQAQIAEQQFQQQLSAHQLQHETMLAEAMAITEQERDAILHNARVQSEQQQQRWQDSLEQEKQQFVQQLRQQGGQSLFRVSEKILNDLANEELEQAIVRHFVKKVSAMLPQLQESSAGALTGEVVSRWEIPAAVQQQLVEQLQTRIPGVRLEFKAAAQEELGIRLHLGGVQVLWTLNSYLDELDVQLQDRVQPLAQRG